MPPRHHFDQRLAMQWSHLEMSCTQTLRVLTSSRATLAELLMKHATWWRLQLDASLAKSFLQAAEPRVQTRQFLEPFVVVAAKQCVLQANITRFCIVLNMSMVLLFPSRQKVQ
jgi:hypothetical protein